MYLFWIHLVVISWRTVRLIIASYGNVLFHFLLFISSEIASVFFYTILCFWFLCNIYLSHSLFSLSPLSLSISLSLSLFMFSLPFPFRILQEQYPPISRNFEMIFTLFSIFYSTFLSGESETRSSTLKSNTLSSGLTTRYETRVTRGVSISTTFILYVLRSDPFFPFFYFCFPLLFLSSSFSFFLLFLFFIAISLMGNLIIIHWVSNLNSIACILRLLFFL